MKIYPCIPAILQYRYTVCHGVPKPTTLPVPALPVLVLGKPTGFPVPVPNPIPHSC